jgi:four helix bundle protein
MTKLEIRNSKLGPQQSAGSRAVRDFKDLMAWRLGRELRKAVYDLTKKFPPEEKYVLTSQMRRAALSVTSNIAEGFGRFHYQVNLQFCRHSRGSATELRDHFTAALDAGYICDEELTRIDQLAHRFVQVINGYIRSTKARQKETKEDADE